MHAEILNEHRLVLLETLTRLPSLKDCYLAGGTALSLQLGLRVSVGFDFFTQNRFNADAVFDTIRALFPSTRVLHLDSDTCDLLVDDVQVSLFRYPYPLYEETVNGQGRLAGLRMAGITDIAVMKLSAIGNRGSRKDFYDLYEIYMRCPGFTGDRLLDAARSKFGEKTDLTYMLMSLTFFDDAETETLPKLFVQADWDEIKAFFREEQRHLFRLEEARFKKNLP